MEITIDEKKKILKGERKKGGLKTMPFIMANETFEKVASVGSHANMILYLKSAYHLSNATGTTIMFLWTAISYATPTIGALVSDSYFGRYLVIAFGSFISFLGVLVLWLTAVIPGVTPPPCKKINENLRICEPAKPSQLLFLFCSFVLMAIGAGGIRACSLAFGADQFDNPKNPKNERILQRFFNWYYTLVLFTVMISVIVVVGIQVSAGWVVGFGVPVAFMFGSIVLFLLGTPTYIRLKPNSSLLKDFGHVIASAWRNRGAFLPTPDSGKWYYGKGSKLVKPTDNLRFLNSACLIRNLDKDLDSEGLAKDPRKLCTVKQVEEFKALIKVLPIWASGITVAVTLSQQTFPVLQAGTMKRHFIGKLTIPAASYGVFTIFTLTIWVAVYDVVLVPILAKITKRPRGLTNKQRMGMGLLVSCLYTFAAGAVEHKRRSLAISEGLAGKPDAVVNMSAMWLVPQHCLIGIAEGLNAIGQIEFYYSQFPKTMSTIGVSLLSLGTAVGNVVGAIIVQIIDHSTKKAGKVSWVSSNLNQGHYDYYYWLLGILSVGNFFYYLMCSRAYGSDDRKIWDDGEETDDEGQATHQPDGSPLFHKPPAA
ncbi:hypothetical protein K2173_015880 [Erythroxylum novogranatense]|uniref:Uncharacterized protein n=1 Tax=Erythroxylum novogranatense TaxID=1862640 RepID=A0AAV8SEW6_9ROSI|nr:hypothetical protein K2173_015880 [Erythroxylum novogranatense]